MFIRSVINSELKDLCPSSQPVTEFLFGDNLSHVIKELNLTNKLGCRPINKHSYSRNRSYARSKGYYKQNSFLGRARAKIPAEAITQNKMVSFKSLLLIKVNSFRGGQLEKYIRQWRKLTNDPNISPIISGGRTEFVDAPRIQHKARSPQFSDEEINLIKDEIDNLLTKGIIKETCHEEKKFVSPIFIYHKSNGGIRLILNLKQLKKSIEYHHFKMDNINAILNLITKVCFIATMDLQDAYYSVKISVNNT